MKKLTFFRFFALAALAVISANAVAQGVFTSAATGNWSATGSWTLSSGSDDDGIPDADDNVTIGSAHTITISASTTVECNNLTVAGGSATSITMAGANSIVNIYGSLAATTAPTAGNYIDCTANATAKAVFKRSTTGDLITGTWGTFGEKVRVEVDLPSNVTGNVAVAVKFRELIVKSGTFSTTGEIRPDEGNANTGKVTIENGATLVTTSRFSRTGTANTPFASLTINGNGKLIINGTSGNALPTVASGFPVYTFSSDAVIEYQGGAQTIADISYPNLVINASGAKTFNNSTSAPRVIAGNVTVSSNRLTVTATTTNTITVNGNISVTGTTSNILMNGGDLICLGNLTLSTTGGTTSAPNLWFASTNARVMGGTSQGTGTFTVGNGSVVRNIFSNTTAGSNTQNPVTTQFPNWQSIDLQTGSTWQYAIPSGASGTRYQDVQDTYNGTPIAYKTLVLSYLNNTTTGSNITTNINNPSIATALNIDVTAATASTIITQNINFNNTSLLTIPTLTASHFPIANLSTYQNITFGAQPVKVTGNVSITNASTTSAATGTVVKLNAGSLTVDGTLTLGSTTASTTLNNPYILLNDASSSLIVGGTATLRSSEQTNGNIKFTNSGQTVTFNGACNTANGNATAEIFNFNGFSPTINFNGNFSDAAAGATFSVTGTEVPVINFNNGTSALPNSTTAANLRGSVTVNGYRLLTSGNFRTSNATTAAYSMNIAGTLDLGANTSVATNTGGGTNVLSGSGAIRLTGNYATQVSGYSSNTLQTAGTLHFAGAALQTIPTGSYNNIILENAAGANLSGDAMLSGVLTLTDGKLILDNNNITVGSISGGSTSAYVATDGTGAVTVSADAGATVSMPIGTATALQQLSLKPTAATTFTAKVYAGVPQTEPSNKRFNQMTWDIASTSPSSTVIEITPSPAITTGLSSFMGHWNGASYDYASAVRTGDKYVATHSAFSPFIVGEADNTTNTQEVFNSLKVYGSKAMIQVDGVSEGAVIHIVNLGGQTVASKIARNANNTFTLNNGMYIVNVTINGNKVSKKVVVL